MSRYWTDKYCCHVARLPAAYFTALTIQTIVTVQAILFLLVAYLRGPEKYFATYAGLQLVFRFHYLMPIIIVQVSWILTAAGTVYSIQRIVPYLMLPHLLTSIFLLITAIAVVALTTYHFTRGVRFTCSLALLLLISSIYSFGALYSVYLTLSCFRLLIHKKNSVRGIAGNDIRKEALPDETSVGINTVSYSRRSTMIVNDNFLYVPYR